MTTLTRRRFLRTAVQTAGAGVALGALPPSIRRALAIPADRRTGTIEDVEHIVVLMLENRSFDHYFGTMAGVRGFGDRFPVPVAGTGAGAARSVWHQTNTNAPGSPATVTPFRLNTQADFDLMRVTGAPHLWTNAQHAWSQGQLHEWPTYKHNHSMAYFGKSDLPFQFALADAFTICDAYHCSFQGGTNPNRVFLWSGTVDPRSEGDGPAMGNLYNKLGGGDPQGGYRWTTYPERLEAAGVSWRIYQNLQDNYALNPLAGFRRYRDSWHGQAGSLPALKQRALSTFTLDDLQADVLAARLPHVSWICPTAEGSEHPAPSSPAQGAAYTARVLEALTANPAVWSRTVLLVMFDENDGFFDHVPPPAAPSFLQWHADPAHRVLAGASTVDTSGEYHDFRSVEKDDPEELMHRPYGLGPRVPMYAISPWSTGGWVNSQVFDHTSVLRFIEQRFGVHEPNISAWRRAVCGDLTSAFDFTLAAPTPFHATLPDIRPLAQRARGLPGTTTPPLPSQPEWPEQRRGTHPSRELPYDLQVDAQSDAASAGLRLTFRNTGRAAAVFHVYDRRHLELIPRRYTVEPGKSLDDVWAIDKSAGYDLWVLGPNGFHRHFTGLTVSVGAPEVRVSHDAPHCQLLITFVNAGDTALTCVIASNAYYTGKPIAIDIPPASRTTQPWLLTESGGWYDFSITAPSHAGFSRRVAGRLETGRDSISDPAMGGPALVHA